MVATTRISASSSEEIRTDTPNQNGLSEEAARLRLITDGFNELPASVARSPFSILIEVVREPMMALLLSGGIVYLFLGDMTEAIILLVFATFSAGITVIQGTRTERVLEGLRNLSSPRAVVIRDGTRRRIPGREVVVCDIIALIEGDRVPADAIVLSARDLQVDESLLTGESVPVSKTATLSGHDKSVPKAGGDGSAFVFSGSLIVRGQGIAQVFATGPHSQIGRIGRTLATIKPEPPPLRKQTQKLVWVFAVLAAISSLMIALIHTLSTKDWREGLLAGITMAMAMLPEEFPVVLAVFMAMGAWRISNASVLTRRSDAIEALGSAQVLCTDKTGTLTVNRMSVAALSLPDGRVAHCRETRGDVPDGFEHLARLGVFASEIQPHDPMEQAFHDLISNHGKQRLVRSYGLRPELMAMSQVWQEEDGQLFVATKGAPEAVARLCRLNEASMAAMLATVNLMASEGLRVLAIAEAHFPRPPQNWPNTQEGLGLRFAGLVGLADSLRSDVPAAIKECQSAGLRVIMITGDYPETAQAIARQAGITTDASATAILTGDELDGLSDDGLAARLRQTHICARILPQQKLRIVEALKAAGQIVAMTGDGVNDAPSLRAAHIGIAMGQRGTDVAREASALVLLNDSFSSIVRAIALGRRIYDNLRKAMGFIVAVHVPIAGLALLPPVLGLPILLGPVHIAFLEMVIDPVCTLVFEAEPEEKGTMMRPPRPTSEPLFSVRRLVYCLAQGLAAFAVVATVYFAAHALNMPEQQILTLTFLSLISAIFALIIIKRSLSTSLITACSRPNPTLIIVAAATVTMLGIIFAIPIARQLFGFALLDAAQFLIPVAAGIITLLGLEGIKLAKMSIENLSPDKEQPFRQDRPALPRLKI